MQPNPANNNQTPQKKNKKKYVIISLLILLAACVLATTISIPLIYSQKSKETTANVAPDFDIVTEQFTQIENSYWNSHDKNENALPALLQKEFAYANKMKNLGVFQMFPMNQIPYVWSAHWLTAVMLSSILQQLMV